jgi:hypothetical protein
MVLKRVSAAWAISDRAIAWADNSERFAASAWPRLIVQRTSRAEQRRFAMTAHDMRVEAMALERAVEAIGC